MSRSAAMILAVVPGLYGTPIHRSRIGTLLNVAKVQRVRVWRYDKNRGRLVPVESIEDVEDTR